MSSLTIAICTRNRSKLLSLCLESLARSISDSFNPVIIVIDNGSTDETKQTCDKFKEPLRLSYYFLETPGLSLARNLALENTTTEYIVYLDDDAQIDSVWAEAILKGIERYNPDLFGGPYRPFYLEEKRKWFKDQYGSAYLNRQEKPLENDEYVSGGNMGWRTEILRKLGGFPANLGMIGGKIGLGEETYIQELAKSKYPDLQTIFLTKMCMTHYVPKEKQFIGYWINRMWIHGKQDVEIFLDQKPITYRWILIEIFYMIRFWILLVFRDRKEFPYWQQYVFEKGLSRFRFWGRVHTWVGTFMSLRKH